MTQPLTLVSTYSTLRVNLAVDPRATGLALSPGQAGWLTTRGFGVGGAGTHSFVIRAVDGPPTITTTVDSYVRKTWTTSPTGAAANSGFQLAGSGLSGTPVIAGTTYTLSSYLRPNSVTGAKIGQCAVYYYDQFGTALTSLAGSNVDVGPATTCAARSWTRIAGTFTAPVGAVYAVPVADIVGTPIWQPNDSLDGTALLWEASPNLDVYFDGTSAAPPNSDLSYLWTGPANASTSIFRQIALLTADPQPPTFTPTSSVTWGLGNYDNPDLQFNGIDSFGVEWIAAVPEGWNKITTDVPLLEGAGDGGWFSPGRRKPRVLTLTGAFRCADQSQMDAAEYRLRAAVEHYFEDQLLWHTPLPTGAGAKQMSVRATGDVSVDYVSANPRIRTFSVVLTAADPLKYAAGSAGLLSYTAWLPNTAGTNGLTFPIGFPLPFGTFNGSSGHTDVYNPGNQAIFPIVTFTGPLTNPSLAALNQSYSLGVNRTLAQGSVVVFDNKNRAVTADGVSVFAQRAANTTFYALLPGDNALYFSHTTGNNPSATATISFRPAWS